MVRSRGMFVVAGLSLVGCYDEGKFNDQFADAYCKRYAECESDIVQFFQDSYSFDAATAQATYDTTYAASCEAAPAEESDETCLFQKEEAKSCVDEMAAVTCDQLAQGALPDACDRVCAAE